MDDITNAARAIEQANTIPGKSKEQYLREYNKFLNWKTENKIAEITEDALLAYFNKLSTEYAPSTLSTTCAKLKACFLAYDDVSIEKYESLQRFLKKTSKGYTPKKAAVFTTDQIHSFVIKAPDDTFLVIKVMLILGVVGVLSKTDIYNLQLSHIQDMASHILVQVKESHTKTPKRFPIVSQPDHPYNPVAVIRKYLVLRQEWTDNPFFLLQLRRGRITKQRIGINTVASTCETVAKYLKIPNFKDYTSHSMRRSGARGIAEGGANFHDLNNYGNWASYTAAQGYVDQSGGVVQLINEIGEKKVDDAGSSTLALECTTSNAWGGAPIHYFRGQQ